MEIWSRKARGRWSAATSFALAAVTLACGGPQFKPTPHQSAVRPLRSGVKVEFVESSEGLAPPVTPIGVISTVSRRGEDDRPQVQKDFRTLAASKGCDAVVGLKLETDEQHSSQKVTRRGADGRLKTVSEDVVAYTYRWSASCVRSGAADAAAPHGGWAPPPPKSVAPPPAAGGSDPAVAELAAKLAPYEIAYLRSWKEKLHANPIEPIDALGATTELMAQVEKFWKITVPMEWLGCKADARSDQCQSHARMMKDFKKPEELRKEMERFDKSPAALAWLRRNTTRVALYLDTYVPSETSESGMRATAFWQDHQPH